MWLLAALGVLLVNRLYATLDWAAQLGQADALRPAYTIFAVDELGLAAAVILLAAVWPVRWRAVGLALFAVYAFLYWVDVQVLKALWHRLTIPYLREYGRQPEPIFWFFGPTRLARNAVLVLAPALVIYRWLRRSSWTLARTPRRALAVLGVLTALAILPFTDLHCRIRNRPVEYFMRNVVQFNAGVLLRRGTDPAVAARVRAALPQLDRGLRALHVDPPPPPPGPRRNVVLLLSESLSRVDSMRSGGLNDRLPQIDAIQRAGLTLTNLVSDGEASSDALASLLIGVPPYPTALLELDMSKRFPVPSGALASRNLAARAHLSGYSTAFLSNSPLEMDGIGAWVKGLGFQRVVGGGSPEFAGAPRFVFDMPADEALYALALEHLRAQAAPSLLVLATCSLHKPYELPDPRDRVEGEPFLSQLRYVDRTTFEFYRALEQAGFFDDGVLVLVGDHRRMTPLDPLEERELGIDATGRVVAAIVGAGVEPGQIDGSLATQTDLFTALYDLVDGKELAEMSAYSKARRLGIGRPFAVSVADAASGIFTVRHPGAHARELGMHAESEPASVALDPIDEPVAAYIILHTAWLQAAQQSGPAHR